MIITKTGVKVHSRWQDNIIVDPDLPSIGWKACQAKDRFTRGAARGLPKIASENSEDALTWNLFRTLEKTGRLNQLLEELGFKDDFKVLYWFRPFDSAAVMPEIQAALNEIEPWGVGGRKQQTETDIILRGGSTLLMVECKLGKSGERVRAWSKGAGRIPQSYEPYCQPLLKDPGSMETNMMRFYQLYRHLMLGIKMGEKWGLEAGLLAVTNSININASGLTHLEEFKAFKSTLTIPKRVHMATWQQIAEAGVMEDPDVKALNSYMKGHGCLKLSTMSTT